MCTIIGETFEVCAFEHCRVSNGYTNVVHVIICVVYFIGSNGFTDTQSLRLVVSLSFHSANDNRFSADRQPILSDFVQTFELESTRNAREARRQSPMRNLRMRVPLARCSESFRRDECKSFRL